MAKRKMSLKVIFLIFFIIEALLVIASGNFSKELKIGFEDGTFVFRNVEKHFDLQDKIAEEFQIDEFTKNSGETPTIYGSETIYNSFKNFFGEESAISSSDLLRMLLIVDFLMIGIALLTRKMLMSKPSKVQILFEMIYGMLNDFVRDTLGKEKTHFTPYIVTLFLFIWICNMIGMVPIPGFMEPTRNLNVPLGLGFIAVFVVHATAIRVKGFWKHLEGYINPIKNPLCLLDLVGEFSKVVSISFRLFGNILGGAIITVVVSSLVKFVMLPIGLNLFFGVFVGTIQAFVFTMLALTYIGVEITE